MTIKALIFDFDGLILDTETPEYLAWQEVYKRYGAHLELSDWLRCVGTSQEAFDPVVNLKDQASITIADLEILKMQREAFYDKMQVQVPMPGIKDYIETGKKQGLKLGIASSSSRHWVDRFLQPIQLDGVFECICTSDDVEKVKPDPALYLCAIQQLNVLPYEAIAFEDSLNGLLAAKNAGLHCVAVPNFVTKKLDFSRADRVLDSLGDIRLEKLLSEFNHHHH